MISLEQFNSLVSKNGVVQICNDQKTELSADNEDKWRKIDEHDLAQNNIYIRRRGHVSEDSPDGRAATAEDGALGLMKFDRMV